MNDDHANDNEDGNLPSKSINKEGEANSNSLTLKATFIEATQGLAQLDLVQEGIAVQTLKHIHSCYRVFLSETSDLVCQAVLATCSAETGIACRWNESVHA
ncbi:hypothetical protein MJO28_017332 [Puccinia striiformis f. sp. tritici]|nr:hypothetical protein MJO28_017850 [Puccinia striiformis f. sp. tritici]KAI7933999.1 hypothetical protein MJO28_017332 [Puccinia striiformis f. sp. tritici]KAI7965633.1 hypothetical protein MJO29_001381 [Puccinia striiformis f. sp. tritici]KAI7965642.1 hypothetical protein MJO29_001390 [Puccinia striiformis f. sp. tritici]